MNSSLLLGGFTAIAIWRLWLFATQRAALQFGRKLDIEDWRLMLPTWYRLTLWPSSIAKWVLIFLLFKSLGIVVAVLAMAVPFVATLIIPIPYPLLLPVFEKTLLKDVSMGALEPQLTIYNRLKALRNDLGMAEGIEHQGASTKDKA